MSHTVPGPARASGVAPLQQVAPVPPCSERSSQPRHPPGASCLQDSPRNAPGADLMPCWTSSNLRLSLANKRVFPASIHNASSTGASPASAPGVRRGQASATSRAQRSFVHPAGAPDETGTSISLQQLIDFTFYARLAGNGDEAAYADCARALAEGWLALCNALVAAASTDIPKWFINVSENAPEAAKRELTRIARGSLEEILSAACFKRHIQSPALMAPLRAPIKQWLALYVAQLEQAGAAQGKVDVRAGANYLRQMDALLELPLPDAVKNGTLRCLISAIAIQSLGD